MNRARLTAGLLKTLMTAAAVALILLSPLANASSPPCRADTDHREAYASISTNGPHEPSNSLRPEKKPCGDAHCAVCNVVLPSAATAAQPVVFSNPLFLDRDEQLTGHIIAPNLAPPRFA